MLLTNQTGDFNHLNNDEVVFIRNAKELNFWNDLKRAKHRNTFGSNKEKYYKILTSKYNPHHQIKLQLIDKLFHYGKCANSTQRNPIKSRKVIFEKTNQNRINLENAHFRVCKITKLNIAMQKKGSKFLCISGLKHYQKNEPEIYKFIEEKYLTAKMHSRPIDEQFYYIAHNIRNEQTNAKKQPNK